MLNARFRLIIVLVAFFLSAGLWALGIFYMHARPPESARTRSVQTRSVRTRGKYAVLVLDDAIPDREIRTGLESSGFSGIISESTQWVFLDSFGSIEQIPLDEYDKRVFPSDPRNDGYAEKLRSLFVRDGQRFVYLPLGFASRAGVSRTGIEKRIASAMGDIPYSLELTVPASRPLKPPWLLFTLFCAAAGALLIIRPLRKELRPKKDEVFKSPPVNRYGHRRFVPVQIIDRRLLSVKFAPAVKTAPAMKTAPAVKTAKPSVMPNIKNSMLSVRAAVLRGFSFLSLRCCAKPGSFGFGLVLLSFAIMAPVLAIIGIAVPRSSAPDVSSHQLCGTLTEEDYYNHFLFQSTFSYRSLNSLDDVPLAGLSTYEYADDGLPVKIPDGDSLIDTIAEIPPFPLRELLQQIGGR